MDKKICVILVIVLIALLAIVSFNAGVFDFLGSKNSDDTVTIGYLPCDHDAALFVADKQGLYKEKNISVELVRFNNGGDLMIAMASGKVDIGYVGIPPVLSAVSKEVPVKIISAAQSEGSGIILSNKSPISSVSDLKGKTVATPSEASIQYFLLKYYLNKNGLSIKEINASTMKTPSINDAIKSDTIDAGLTFQPYVSASEANGNKVLVTSHEILPNHPCCVVVASQDFIDKKPDTVKDIIAIHENATKFINNNVKNNTSAIVELLPDDIVSNKEVEVKSLESFPFVYGLNETFKSDVDAFMKLEVELGLLQKPVPHDQLFWDGN